MITKKSTCIFLIVSLIVSAGMLSTCSAKKDSNTSDETADSSSFFANNSTIDTEKATSSSNKTTASSDDKNSSVTGGKTTSETDKKVFDSTTTGSSSVPETIITPSTASSMSKENIKAQDGSVLSYWLYTPKNATANMPLLIYLHGGSGKGNDLDILVQNDGFPKYLKDGTFGEIPAYVVIPQVSSNFKGWSDIKNSVRDLINACIVNYRVNAKRVSLTGHSMGGTGAWSLAALFPNLFSCVAPLSGSITVNDANVKALANMPVWAFVGSADSIVKPDSSIQFISKLKSVNNEANITVFDVADHFSVPTLTYLDKNLNVIKWLISQTK